MQRRAFVRISANIRAQFYSGFSPYNAVVSNFSENGMCISTVNCLPCGYRVEIHLTLQSEIIKMPATIRRIVKSDDLHFTIGLELINPPQKYLLFVDNYRQMQ